MQISFNWRFKITDHWAIRHSLLILILKYFECMHDQSCPILCEPMDCSPPGSSVHGILQARILEWVAISSSKGSSWSRDWTRVSCASCIGRQVLYHWATREAQVSIFDHLKSYFPLKVILSLNFDILNSNDKKISSIQIFIIHKVHKYLLYLILFNKDILQSLAYLVKSFWSKILFSCSQFF